MARKQALTDLLTAVHAALEPKATGIAKAAVERIFTALRTPGEVVESARQPLSDALAPHLPVALQNAQGPLATPVSKAFAALAPQLSWQKRPGSEKNPEFHASHANTPIIGPTGELERRDDVIVGAGLMPPNATYPFHSHPPEELYVVLSNSEWFLEEKGWYRPGIGGVIYHPPRIKHAMRADDAPLLAVWCLYVEPEDR
ncbi:MAG: dimethylsulfonioproprionate lyase family protein [Pseudomonadota bacterium]